MRHLYRCPLRWADLDPLGHVNNVMFVDYLQEARLDMFRAHAPARSGTMVEGAVIARNDVTYLRPLVLQDSVAVEIWVTEIRAASFTLAYEIFDLDEAGERIVYLRATSVTTPFVFDENRPRRLTAEEVASLERFLEPGERSSAVHAVPAPRDAYEWDVDVRFSDVDSYQHVNNVKYFEYFQEARIAAFRPMFKEAPDTGGLGVVVARMVVDYKRAMVLRADPYLVHSWISRVGNSSYDVSAEAVDPFDEGRVMARSVATLVTFDPSTQTAAAPSQAYRQVLLDNLRPTV